MSYTIVDPLLEQGETPLHMKKGGKVTVKAKAKKGKIKVTAMATANVTVNIGKKSRNVNTNPPRPTALQQIIPLFQSLLSQRPSLTYETEPRGISRLLPQVSGPIQPFTMHKMPDGHIMMDQPLPFRNQFIPVANSPDYEPIDPIETKHEKEPDEPLMIYEEDLLAPKKLVESRLHDTELKTEKLKNKVRLKLPEEIQEEDLQRQVDEIKLAIEQAKPGDPYLPRLRTFLARRLKKQYDFARKK